jgi:hypothetical protein
MVLRYFNLYIPGQQEKVLFIYKAKGVPRHAMKALGGEDLLDLGIR